MLTGKNRAAQRMRHAKRGMGAGIKRIVDQDEIGITNCLTQCLKAVPFQIGQRMPSIFFKKLPPRMGNSV